jgi:hypothetical protein
MYHGRVLKPRTFRDILAGMFYIDRMIRINRKNDENTISNKIFDFSSKTTSSLGTVAVKMLLWIQQMLKRFGDILAGMFYIDRMIRIENHIPN